MSLEYCRFCRLLTRHAILETTTKGVPSFKFNLCQYCGDGYCIEPEEETA